MDGSAQLVEMARGREGGKEGRREGGKEAGSKGGKEGEGGGKGGREVGRREGKTLQGGKLRKVEQGVGRLLSLPLTKGKRKEGKSQN